jgi:hypothetical protein
MGQATSSTAFRTPPAQDGQAARTSGMPAAPSPAPDGQVAWALTPQQRTFFATFGYLHLPGLMRERMAEISAEFDRVFLAAGIRHDGGKHSVVVPFLDHSAVLSSLLEDPRLVAINAGVFAGAYNYLNSAGNFYVGDTPWHSDVPLRPVWPDCLRSINISFYLDPVTSGTGALRVIPGSHRAGEGFSDALIETLEERRHCERLGLEGSGIPALALETEPGDLIVFNNYLKHASFGGGDRRRMLVLNFSRSYPLEHRKDLQGIGYGGAVLAGAGPVRMAQLVEVLDAHERGGSPLPLAPDARAAYLSERERLRAHLDGA